MRALGREVWWPTTEQPNPASAGLDRMEALGAVQTLVAGEERVVPAVAAEAAQIATGAERIAEAFRTGHRVFYAGAGTAGRIGVLDASEIPPTFGVDGHWFRAVIAGGDRAIRSSVENAEDGQEQAAADLRAEGIGPGDVIAITANGGTPYAMGTARLAQAVGATVIAVVNNPGSPLGEVAGIVIRLLVGPEVLLGSSRLSAGSAQKLVLNALSTTAMVLVGKVYDNRMVDFRPSNRKLLGRAERVFMWVTGATRAKARQCQYLAASR